MTRVYNAFQLRVGHLSKPKLMKLILNDIECFIDPLFFVTIVIIIVIIIIIIIIIINIIIIIILFIYLFIF